MTPARLWRAVALGAWLVLVLSLLVWYRGQPWLALLVAAPLALPLPGLWRGRRYTYQWCSLLVLFYAGFGLTEAIATPAARLFAYVAASASALLFVACVLYTRSAGLKPAAPRAPSGS